MKLLFQLLSKATSMVGGPTPGGKEPLQLIRFSDGGDSTLGLLFLDGKFECYILEDQHNDIKVYGETRIPAGVYPITLRTEGTTHEAYKKRFATYHIGTLHIRNIPGYKYVLIHVGNTDEDTLGCLLTGDAANNNQYRAGRVKSSTVAYERLYKKIAPRIKNGEKIKIRVIDFDRGEVI